MSNETSFSIDITAESGKSYMGEFKVRKRLNAIQRLKLDEIRRGLIGQNPVGTPDDVMQTAFVLATCQAHVIEAPDWWTKADSGLSLLDEDPSYEVFKKIREAQAADRKDLITKGEAAVVDLKK